MYGITIHQNPNVREFVPLGIPYNSDLGLGDLNAVVSQQTAQIAGIAATGAAVTGSMLASLAGLSIAGPIGAAVAALIGIGVGIANIFSGCGDTCVEASNIANQVGQVLSDNVHKYIESPVRYKSMQDAALNNFDVAWNALSKACSDPQLGQAGVNCISNRQRGACQWQSSPGGWNPDGTYTWAGVAGSGSTCWNYFSGMRDPIANDPFVQPDPLPPSPVSAISNMLPTSITGSGSGLLIIGGLGLLGLFLAFGD